MDLPVTLYTRDSDWSGLNQTNGPVIVAVRNDDLSAVLARVPDHRHADLVFVQNGMLRGWLSEVGRAEATRGLLFFAVSKRGQRAQPGGISPLCGPHALAVSEWLCDIGLNAHAVSADAFGLVEFEKLLWNVIYCLSSERFGVSVGRLVVDYSLDIKRLFHELVDIGEPTFGVVADRAALLDRLNAYSSSIPDYCGTMKEWPWRNGWFVKTAQDLGRPSPEHQQGIDAVRSQRN